MPSFEVPSVARNEAPRTPRQEQLVSVREKLSRLCERKEVMADMAECAKAKDRVYPGLQRPEDIFRSFISDRLYGLEHGGITQTGNTAWYCEEENAHKVAGWLAEAGLDASVRRITTCCIGKDRPDYQAVADEVDRLAAKGMAYWLGEEKLFFSLRGDHPDFVVLIAEHEVSPDTWFRAVGSLPAIKKETA